MSQTKVCQLAIIGLETPSLEEQTSMKTKAAVLWGLHEMGVEEIDLDGPRHAEVMFDDREQHAIPTNTWSPATCK